MLVGIRGAKARGAGRLGDRGPVREHTPEGPRHARRRRV